MFVVDVVFAAAVVVWLLLLLLFTPIDKQNTKIKFNPKKFRNLKKWNKGGKLRMGIFSPISGKNKATQETLNPNTKEGGVTGVQLFMGETSCLQSLQS